jgi:bifunctional UDP-N-acetylglucosamine pyrophosphorylase / glucosamine-1-phosphate N-acetyltransferase
MKRVLIVPAAGRGSRLGSELPKLLVPVNGRAMVDYLFDLYRGVVFRFILVVSPAGLEPVKRHCAGRKESIDLLVQPEPTGMLDAILVPHETIHAIKVDEVWVTWCDQIAVQPGTVARLATAMNEMPRPSLVFPTVESDGPYIHFPRDSDGRITGVLHRREGDAMPERGEGDIGLFAMSAQAYLDDLPEYAARAALGAQTGERNYLPFIPWLARRDLVKTVAASSAIEAIGINTPEELDRIAQHLASS